MNATHRSEQIAEIQRQIAATPFAHDPDLVRELDELNSAIQDEYIRHVHTAADDADTFGPFEPNAVLLGEANRTSEQFWEAVERCIDSRYLACVEVFARDGRSLDKLLTVLQRARKSAADFDRDVRDARKENERDAAF